MSPTEIDIDDVISRIDYLVLLAVRRCVVRCDDADDLRQDIFIALFNRVQKFDSRLSSWSTFINMIIESEIQHFCLSKRWRKNQTFSSIDDLTESEHPLTNFYPICDLNDQERFFFWHEFDDAIKKLPEAVREICFC
ncbi:MAG: hypothetical protein LBH59_10920, partial [Planctomycetaceae bacterium]|nr:hypothetical protein [Planctomycetaceae bacterium]